MPFLAATPLVAGGLGSAASAGTAAGMAAGAAPALMGGASAGALGGGLGLAGSGAAAGGAGGAGLLSTLQGAGSLAGGMADMNAKLKAGIPAPGQYQAAHIPEGQSVANSLSGANFTVPQAGSNGSQELLQLLASMGGGR